MVKLMERYSPVPFFIGVYALGVPTLAVIAYYLW